MIIQLGNYIIAGLASLLTFRKGIIYYQRILGTTKEDYHHGSSLLCEMPQQEGDERSQIDYDEERKASHTGNLSLVWYQDVQNRESIKYALINNRI